MHELSKEKAIDFTLEARRKEEKITQWVCFGLVFMCHCFIKDGYLFFGIPLFCSIFSIGADWVSNWRAYYYYEKCDDKENFTLPDFDKRLILAPFVLAMLSFAILYIKLYYIN